MSELALGLMSGTSLDGIDAALVRFSGDRPDAQLAAFHTQPYTDTERQGLLRAIASGTAPDLAALHVDLGRLLAKAAAAALDRAGVGAGDLSFIATHGQTVWHAPGRATLQLGDPAVIAERLGVRVVSDFRSRDVAAGGQGAPLVPVADALLFAPETGARALLNIGGMANVTWIPDGASLDGIIAFDTGPGMAVVDEVVRATEPGSAFDRDGARAARGTVREAIVQELLRHDYFRVAPPKSTGREAFGPAMAGDLLARVRAEAPDPTGDDAVATAVALTARSVADQLERWLPARPADLVVSGGGARNATLMRGLRDALGGWTVVPFDELYFDGDAKEAVAFALLGWLTLRGRAGNVPAATGAAGPRVLGRITPA